MDCRKKFFLLFILCVFPIFIFLTGCEKMFPSGSGEEDGEFIIANYIGLFDGTTKNFLRTDIPYDKMNRLYIAFAMINWDEATKMYYLDYDPLDDRTAVETIINNCLQKNQNEPNVEIFMSCGYGVLTEDDYHNAAQSQYVGGFADSVVDFIKENIISVIRSQIPEGTIVVGFDMDLESTGTKPEDVTALVTTLRHKFDDATNADTSVIYKLTITPWYYPYITDLDWNSIKSKINQVNLMYTYGQYSSVLAGLANYLIGQGLTSDQIIAGIQSEGPQDSIDTIDDKCNYIKQNNLGGMMNWRIDNDNRDASGHPTYEFALEMYNQLSGQ